jgi:hypothetical protein
MIPKSCRLFGQDHATEQMLRTNSRFNPKRFRSNSRGRRRCAAAMRDIDHAFGQLARQPGCEPRAVAAGGRFPDTTGRGGNVSTPSSDDFASRGRLSKARSARWRIWAPLLCQARSRHCLQKQGLHGGRNILVGADLEEQSRRGAVLHVAGDLRLERRNIGRVP